MESLLAGKKKRLDKDKQDRMDELKAKLDKHRYHIRKLETLLRMLDNMSVEVNTVSVSPPAWKRARNIEARAARSEPHFFSYSRFSAKPVLLTDQEDKGRR